MKKLLFLLLLTSCGQSQPYYIQAQNQTPPPPATRNCYSVNVVNYVCGRNQFCGYLVCDIYYQDNSRQTVCTNNPTEPKQVCN
jgi:hypothetical protein